MASKKPANEPDPRDASLRVSKKLRDSLKAAAAVMGRPLYDITNEAIYNYLDGLKLTQELERWRKTANANAAANAPASAPSRGAKRAKSDA